MAAGRPREGDKALLAAASVETSGEWLAMADRQKKVEVGNLWLPRPLGEILQFATLYFTLLLFAI
jgi:hypothetical protein